MGYKGKGKGGGGGLVKQVVDVAVAWEVWGEC
jgi:hypothetical protein